MSGWGSTLAVPQVPRRKAPSGWKTAADVLGWAAVVFAWIAGIAIVVIYVMGWVTWLCFKVIFMMVVFVLQLCLIPFRW